MMAISEDVTTVRSTPTALAADKTRRVPSTAGEIISFSSSGSAMMNGEATCKTYLQPAIASDQPSSLVRSASTNVRLSIGATFAIPSRTASAFSIERIVPTTSYP